MRTVSVEEAAAILKLSVRSLGDARYRERIGLRAVRIGPRHIVFLEREVLTLLRRGRGR